VKGERDDSAWTTCVDALRSNWVGEIAPSEVVAIMCQALDEIGDRTIPRDDHARKNPQPQAVSQQSPRLKAADCTATNSGTHAGENVPIAGDTGMHSAAQRNAIPEANVRKTVANGEAWRSQT
jgi:hypothetical protein